MKINLIQTDIVWGDPQANCEHLDKMLGSAEPADLYVLPEMFSTGFATLPNATVEHEPSVGLAWMQRKARESVSHAKRRTSGQLATSSITS